MIVKVKEPLPQEYPLLREDQVLFTYLHLAPAPELTKALLEPGDQSASPTRPCNWTTDRCRCSRP